MMPNCETRAVEGEGTQGSDGTADIRGTVDLQDQTVGFGSLNLD